MAGVTINLNKSDSKLDNSIIVNENSKFPIIYESTNYSTDAEITTVQLTTSSGSPFRSRVLPFFRIKNDNDTTVKTEQMTLSNNNLTATGSIKNRSVFASNTQPLKILFFANIYNNVSIDETNVNNVDITTSETLPYSYNPNDFNVGDTVLTIRAKPKSGYTITDIPTLKLNNYTTIQNFTYDANNNDYYYEVKNPNPSNITYSDFIFHITANALKESIIQKFACMEVYKVNKQTMLDLRDKRFIVGGTTAVPEYEDLGKYILSYRMFPFNIETQNTFNIFLGGFDTELSTDIIDDAIFIFETQPFPVYGLNRNISDVGKSKVQIFLKNYGFVDYPSEYINKTIKMRYIIDIVNNTCSTEFICNDKIFMNVKYSLGYDIPYILTLDGLSRSYVNNLTCDLTLQRQPFIKLEQKPKVYGTHYNVNVVRTVKNYYGFNRYADVCINSINNATNEEIALIKDILANGIYQ